jgi:hypothetical protein
LTERLLTISFPVLPVTKDLNDLFDIINNINPKLIVFDTVNNYSDVFKFLRFISLKTHIRILFLGNLDHTINSKLNKINNSVTDLPLPINSMKLKDKVHWLLGINKTDLKDLHSESSVLNFFNQTIQELLKLVPRELKSQISNSIFYALDSNIPQSPYLSRESNSSYKINVEQFDDEISLLEPLKNVIIEIRENLRELFNDEDAGDSIVNDALYQSLFKAPDSDRELLIKFIELLGSTEVNTYNIQNLDSYKSSLTNNTQIGFIALEDEGPELKIQENPIFGEVFDGLTVGQLISLVGQGELYHEGLYGPLPVSSNSSLMSIIYSKKLKNPDIKDERLRGYTLSLICIMFEKDLATVLPTRQLLTTVFDSFSNLTDIYQVNSELLLNINQKFQNLLK